MDNYEWKMLSPPRNGWVRFRLEGFEDTYPLSYMWDEDLAFEWIDHALCGLRTLSPFCVKGSLEMGNHARMICVVYAWSCRVLVEDSTREKPKRDLIGTEYSPVRMIDFCRYLYEDIRENIDGWVDWISTSSAAERQERKRRLIERLERLKEYIVYYGDELF